MGEGCIQYGGGVHTVWGRCAYSMGEVCIQYGGGKGTDPELFCEAGKGEGRGVHTV